MIEYLSISDFVDIETILKNIFAITLASKEFIRKDIDTIFNEDKLIYLNYYKKSDIYKTVLNQSSSFEIEQYTEKVIGIIEYCLDVKNMTILDNLYKKAFKKLYNNTKNLNVINPVYLLPYLSYGIEGNFEMFSTLYIYYLYGKFDLNIIETNEMLNSSIRDFVFLEKYLETNYCDEAILANKKELIDISKKLGIKKKMYTLEELLNDIIDKDIENYNNSITCKEPANILTIQKVGSISKYIGSIEGTLKYLQIDSPRLAQRTTFTQKEINMILMSFIYSKQFNNFTDKDLGHTIINLIYLNAIYKEYKKLREKYLINVNEEHLLEIDNLQSDLISSKNKFEKLSEQAKIKEQSLINKEKEMLLEIENLKKENLRLTNELKETEELKQEVIKLRNIVFSTEYEDNIVLEDNIIDIDKLNNLKIAIIGGNLNWIKKLKLQFPNWVYISTDQLNNDFNIVKRCNFIFINTKMKHSLYFKIKAFISKYNIKYDYLEALENVTLNIQYIYDKLHSENLI